MVVICLISIILGGTFKAESNFPRNINLTNNGSYQDSPSFSFDGKYILYSSKEDRGDYYDIWIMKCDGSEHRQLTNDNHYQTQPKMSPDGEKIVFIESNQRVYNIWMMNSDGTDKIKLTDDGHNYVDPSFSPDGEKIIYMSGGRSSWAKDIWMMDKDGGNHEILFTNTYYPEARWPSINYNRSIILFQLLEFKAEEGSQFWCSYLFLYNINNQILINLSEDSRSIDCPIFSPGEESIIYIECNVTEDKYDVIEYNLGTGNRTYLFNSSDYIYDLSISKDGKRIVYSGVRDIWLYEMEKPETDNDHSYINNSFIIKFLILIIIVALILVGGLKQIYS